MSRQPSEPLTAEERALADMLARDRGVSGPPPAVDAAILGAARAAVRRGPAAPTPAVRHRRALAGLGLAASIVLAVGVAWQLRPGAAPEPVTSSEAPTAATVASDAGSPPEARQAPRQDLADADPAMPAAAAGATRRDAAVAGPQAEEARVDPPPPAAAAPHRDQHAGAAMAATAAAAPAPSPQEPVPAVDAPREEPAPALPAPPPAPPPAPSMPARPPADAPRAAPAPRDVDPQRAREMRRAQRVATPAMEAERKTAMEAAADAAPPREDSAAIVFEAGSYDQPLDDQPPASADSPEVQQAWLTRIGELVEEEQYEAARASLAEFRRRYPEAPLPDGLRRLLE